MQARNRQRFTAFALSLGLAFATQVAHAASALEGFWQGTLTTNDGKTEEINLQFDANGYLLYSYTDSNGVVKQVSQDTIGKKIEYLPRGGGVSRATIRYVEKNDSAMLLLRDDSFEKVSNGYMTQNYHTLGVYVRLAANGGLETWIEMQSTYHSNDAGSSFSGLSSTSENYYASTGVLHKTNLPTTP